MPIEFIEDYYSDLLTLLLRLTPVAKGCPPIYSASNIVVSKHLVLSNRAVASRSKLAKT